MPGPTYAFFGATGDCVGYCLAHTLKAGNDCIALARTPKKLTDSMQAKGVDTAVVEAHLTIIEGNAKDVEAVKKALQLNGRIVDYIVVGVGGQMQMQWSLMQPTTLSDPTICQDVMKTIIEALKQLKPTNKPTLLNISTTGIWPKGKPRDIPIPYIPFYRWFLHSPHVDKQVLEDNLREHIQLPKDQQVIKGYVHIKPSLLVGEGRSGLDKIRFGVDEAPALGYTITREDVGEWMFESLIKSELRPEWINKSVSITL